MIDVIRDLWSVRKHVRVIMSTGFQYKDCSIEEVGNDYFIINELGKKHLISLAHVSTVVY